jgi:hypothetical protein
MLNAVGKTAFIRSPLRSWPGGLADVRARGRQPVERAGQEALDEVIGILDALRGNGREPRPCTSPVDINPVVKRGGGPDTAAMSTDLPADEAMKQLVAGVRHVFIAASGLDWALT